MTVRMIVIFVVAIVILAIYFKDPIYNWFKDNFKK